MNNRPHLNPNQMFANEHHVVRDSVVVNVDDDDTDKGNLSPKLTFTDKRTFCELDFDSVVINTNDPDRVHKLAALAALKNEKKALALQLAEAFENGGNNTARDERIAADYYGKAGKEEKKAHLLAGQAALETKYAYLAPVWYTGGRLGTLRINRFWVTLGKYLHKTFTPFFLPVFSLLGLSYGFEVIFHLAMVIKHTAFPKTDAEKKLGPAKRFINAMTKGKRMYRLLNAIVWFAVNLTAIIVSGGILGFARLAAPTVANLVFSVLNLFGFSFDVVNEGQEGYRDRQRYNSLERQYESLRRSTNLTDQAKARIIKNLLDKKLAAQGRNWAWDVAAVVMVVVGMGLFLFPFGGQPLAVALVGAGLALLGGSVLTGFGRRVAFTLWDYVIKPLFSAIKACFTSSSDKANKPKPKNSRSHDNPNPDDRPPPPAPPAAGSSPAVDQQQPSSQDRQATGGTLVQSGSAYLPVNEDPQFTQGNRTPKTPRFSVSGPVPIPGASDRGEPTPPLPKRSSATVHDEIGGMPATTTTTSALLTATTAPPSSSYTEPTKGTFASSHANMNKVFTGVSTPTHAQTIYVNPDELLSKPLQGAAETNKEFSQVKNKSSTEYVDFLPPPTNLTPSQQSMLSKSLNSWISSNPNMATRSPTHSQTPPSTSTQISTDQFKPTSPKAHK